MSFSHSAVGGATDRIFCVSLVAHATDLLRPTSLPAVMRRPGGVIAASLDCRAPCFNLMDHPPDSCMVPTRTLCLLPDGSVGSWGLFPSHRVNSSVVVPSDFAASGFGIRRLTPRELADLWNTPILIQDAFVKRSCDTLLRAFTSGVPAKVLSVAADYLLANFFRGGYTSFLPVEPSSSPDHLSSKLQRQQVEHLPLSNEDECLPPCSDFDVHQSGLTVEGGDIIKQDGQKADNAEVPVHIWEVFFRDSMPDNFPPLHPDWRTRLESYRSLGLIFWRKCRLRSFWRWVEKKIPAHIWKLRPRVSR